MNISKYISYTWMDMWLNLSPTSTLAFLIRATDSHQMTGSKLLASVLLVLNRSSLFLFQQLIELAVYDRPGKKLRFDLLYVLLSIRYNNRVILQLQLQDAQQVPSATAYYPGASWIEREVWDLFGIFFTNHNDMRRIVTDYGFLGNPLRRDFPLTGFLETAYEEEQKQVAYRLTELSQNMRHFNHQSAWLLSSKKLNNTL